MNDAKRTVLVSLGIDGPLGVSAGIGHSRNVVNHKKRRKKSVDSGAA